MSIVTITSDFGYKDHYISALKAKLYRLMPDLKIVDISHDIKKFNFRQGVFVLKNVMYEFPENSVHIFAVNEGGQANDNDFFLIKLEDQYVIGTGLSFISMFDNPKRTIIKILKLNKNTTFPSLDIFVKTTFQLFQNIAPSEIGELQNDISNQNQALIDIQQSGIWGTIMHIDGYGNVLTNISKFDFEENRNNRIFEIRIGRDSITQISTSYHDVNPGDSLALFNANNLLEIALSFGNASRLYGVKIDGNIKITFRN